MGIKSPKAVREQRKRDGYYKGYYVAKINVGYGVRTGTGEWVEVVFENEVQARSFIDRMRTLVLPVAKRVNVAPKAQRDNQLEELAKASIVIDLIAGKTLSKIREELVHA